MNRKSISIVLAYIVLSSALGLSGYLYFDLDKRHTKLQSNYDGLDFDYQSLNDTYRILVNDYAQLNRTHQILILEYNELNASYRILAYNYTGLKQDYSELSSNYTTLEQNYNDLSDQYASLFSDYNELLEAFNEPLSYEEIPTTSELTSWLALDETDEIWYNDPNFKCGDFAVMLSQHAKLEYWDIGIVAIFGYTETYESYAHAFNAIITIEGLVYVEPQNDHVWWYSNHEAIYEETWFEIDDEWIYVEEYVIITSYN